MDKALLCEDAARARGTHSRSLARSRAGLRSGCTRAYTRRCTRRYTRTVLRPKLLRQIGLLSGDAFRGAVNTPGSIAKMFIKMFIEETPRTPVGAATGHGAPGHRGKV